MGSSKYFLTFLFLALCSLTAIQALEFDEECEQGANDQCNKGSFLYCNKWNRCVCDESLGLTLVYDPVIRNCSIPVGSTCFKVPEAGEPTCSSHAGCTDADWMPVGKGICNCTEEGYVSHSNHKRCLKRNVPLGDYCESDNINALHSCNSKGTCQGGKCECNGGGRPINLDPTTGDCAYATGSTCDLLVEDPNEITCGSYAECVKSEWATNGLCKCKPNTENDYINNICHPFLTIGEDCKQPEPYTFTRTCIQYANCSTLGPFERCHCLPQFETVGEDNTECHLKGSGLVDDPCVVADSTCGENSECIPDATGAPFGTCKCSRGHTPTISRQCEWSPKDYQERCEEDIECNHKKSQGCRGTMEKMCACMDPATMIYDAASDECLTTIGGDGICHLQPVDDVPKKCIHNADCNALPGNATYGSCACKNYFETTGGDNSKCVLRGTGLADEPCYISEPKCHPNSECKPIGTPGEEVGLCKCIPGHKPNNVQQCFWTPNAYGEVCSEPIECNHRKSHRCLTGRCTCADPTMYYNSTDPNSECLTRIGEGSCLLNPSEDEVPKRCVENADCIPAPGNPTEGACQCKENFAPNSDKRCDASSGAGALFAAPLLAFAIFKALLFH